MLLWKMICSNKLLQNVELVLFLNKCDILDRKLKSGIKLAKYVRSFQDRPNDSETVQKCEFVIGFLCCNNSTDDDDTDFRAKFNAIHREYSPKSRKFYGFCTSVTVCIISLSLPLVSMLSLCYRKSQLQRVYLRVVRFNYSDCECGFDAEGICMMFSTRYGYP